MISNKVSWVTTCAAPREMKERGVQHLVQAQHGAVTLAECWSMKEADEAKRAFENVLAPRFTKGEAVAIVHSALAEHAWSKTPPSPAEAIAFTIKALEAAGVFIDLLDKEGFR